MADNNQNTNQNTGNQAGSQPAAAGQNTQQTAQQGGNGGQQTTPPAFDYDKLANLITGAQNAKEDSVLKNYFKQQGLSQEEAAMAIQQFKQQKAASTPDIGAIQQQLAQANTAAARAQIENRALLMAGEIGVDIKTIPYVIKMADLSQVIVDGSVDGEKLKEALNKVLEDIPQLKGAASSETGGSGFRVGADTGSTGAQQADNEALARAFGIKKK